MYRSGLRDLEIHYTYRSRWYYERAEKILTALVDSYLSLHGPRKFLRGLSSPVFFDALSVASFLDELEGGATTIMATVFKNIIRPEDGLAVVGGKRLEGYRVPAELDIVGREFGFSSEKLEKLKYASRMVAKVDNVAIQDGFPLYFHMMIVSRDGEWTVVQQGIKTLEGLVRRYHWTSIKIKSFVEEPHTGIISAHREKIVIDMTSMKSDEARKACVELVTQDFKKLKRLHEAFSKGLQMRLTDLDESVGDIKLEVPSIKWVYLQSLYNQQPRNFEELLSHRGIGVQTLRFLVFACIQLYQVYPSFEDPAISFDEAYRLTETLDDERIYEVMDALKESSLEIFLKKVSYNRLSNFIQGMES
ncbi:MAG: DUF763 domain-containing protein [Nitrososphaerota archaeon]